MPLRERLNSEQKERIQHYLQKAEHLDGDQRRAMNQGIPFVGMTYEEATIAMTLVSWQGKVDGRVLKAQFAGGSGRTYVLFFDCGTPNRVMAWSVFTDEEIEELTEFPDVNPDLPIVLPRINK